MSLYRRPKWAQACGNIHPHNKLPATPILTLVALLFLVAQSFVLNPLAGLVGADGKPTMVLVDEGAISR